MFHPQTHSGERAQETPIIGLSEELEGFLASTLKDFPWTILVSDWEGRYYALGKGEPHWRGEPLRIEVRTPEAARDILGLRGLRVLERYLVDEVRFSGNLYLLTWIRKYASGLEVGLRGMVAQVLKNYRFQGIDEARINVRSHYNAPGLERYLDQAYFSYSCGMWEDVEPSRFDVDALVRVGEGEPDDWDSLEKAQWRKFDDAARFADPAPGETVLDIGCGYGGQLIVGQKLFPEARFVGWNQADEQVKLGRRKMEDEGLDPEALMLGDYRNDHAAYDHVLSTGMISHVGPRGLVPYVRKARRLVKTGGRYMHHALMRPYSPYPLEFYVGAAFNKKYVWPGFHWFSIGDHMRALEKNGFRIVGEKNLSLHYGKTTAAWYERFMAQADFFRKAWGEQSFRAWQIYLSGASAGFRSGIIEVHRIYCEAR